MARSVLVLPLVLAGCAGTASREAPPSPQDIPRLEARVAERPEDVGARVRLGAAYREAGRASRAASALEAAVERAPGHGPAVLLLGLTYEDLELYGQARELYGRFLQSSPETDLREAVEARLRILRRKELALSIREALRQETAIANLPPPEERAVGVFPFVYAGPDSRLAPLSRALAYMVTGDLALVDRVRVLERLEVQTLLDEMALAEQGLVDRGTAARGGRILGANRVVQGRIQGTEGSLVVDAAVVPVGSGEPAEPDPVTEEEAGGTVFDLEKRLVLGLFQAMGIQLTPAERERIEQRRTSNLQALLAFGEGLEAWDAGDWATAAERFQEASTLDPGFGDAAEWAADSREIAAAGGLSTDGLAELAVDGVAGAGTGDGLASPEQRQEWLRRQTLFRELEALLPDAAGRDAVAEVMGREGLGERSAILELILRPPGGDR